MSNLKLFKEKSRKKRFKVFSRKKNKIKYERGKEERREKGKEPKSQREEYVRRKSKKGKERFTKKMTRYLYEPENPERLIFKLLIYRFMQEFNRTYELKVKVEGKKRRWETNRSEGGFGGVRSRKRDVQRNAHDCKMKNFSKCPRQVGTQNFPSN